MKKGKKNPHAVALGRKGGLKGGPARAARMTPQQRSESARKAVTARWLKYYAEKEKLNGSKKPKRQNRSVVKIGKENQPHTRA